MALMLSHSRLGNFSGEGTWTSDGVYVGPALEVVAPAPASPSRSGMAMTTKLAIAGALGLAITAAFILGRDGDA